MTRKQGAVRQQFVVDEGNQETEIEFLRATIYLHEVEPRTRPQALSIAFQPSRVSPIECYGTFVAHLQPTWKAAACFTSQPRMRPTCTIQHHRDWLSCSLCFEVRLTTPTTPATGFGQDNNCRGQCGNSLRPINTIPCFSARSWAERENRSALVRTKS